MGELLLKNRMMFDFDNELKKIPTLFSNGFEFIIGVDEAGRGPAAGRVYAAAVCFFADKNLDERLFDINDSKKLTQKKREELYPIIKENSIYSICYSDIDKIEELNILNATFIAMKKAISDVYKKLKNENVLILVDGNRRIKDLDLFQKTVVKGDMLSASIAAASILAKVERDRYMVLMDKKYKGYDFLNNKGYLTKSHIEAIRKLGICDIHRKSFLKNILK